MYHKTYVYYFLINTRKMRKHNVTNNYIHMTKKYYKIKLN